MAFDREGAKAAGYSDAEIDAFLQTGGEPADTVSANPRTTGGATNPLTEATGAVSGALNAIGGPRTLLFGGGGLAALEGARRFLSRKQEEPPRANKGKGGKSKTTRGKGKATNPRAKVPTRPIDVEGKPAARAPAQTENPRYTGGRGASGPELARRAAMMERFQAGQPPFAPRPGMQGPDPEIWRTRGISVPRGTIPRVAGGGANVLLALLNAATIPQQMQEAQQVVRGSFLEDLGLTPEQIAALEQQGI